MRHRVKACMPAHRAVAGLPRRNRYCGGRAKIWSAMPRRHPPPGPFRRS